MKKVIAVIGKKHMKQPNHNTHNKMCRCKKCKVKKRNQRQSLHKQIRGK